MLVPSSLLTDAACRLTCMLRWRPGAVANVLAFPVDLTSACNPVIYSVFAFAGFSAATSRILLCWRLAVAVDSMLLLLLLATFMLIAFLVSAET